MRLHLLLSQKTIHQNFDVNDVDKISVLPNRGTICVLAALEKRRREPQDGGNDVMDQVAHGGPGENGEIVTGEDEVAREREGDGGGGHLRDPPVVLGKHRTRLYP